jgi:putative SOS response-associated peptidase YedK
MNRILLSFMCGRYLLKSPPAELSDLFGIEVRDNFPPRYNICPSQPIAIICQNERRHRDYALARWGFIPSWQKKAPMRPLINARAETVLEKPSFRSAFKRRRCLIPADGFYEWRSGGGGAKQPFFIERSDHALFAFAGIWETACDPEGGEIDTAAILTTGSGADLRAIHAREPVVIAPEHFALWLEADERDVAMLDDLLTPAGAGSWSARAVSTAVNSPRHDGPELIEPLAA